VTLTLSGRYVRRQGGEALTLRDIGLALGRVPRFGGHCRYHWTVLHHSIAAGKLADMVDYQTGQRQAGRVLGALLHDAHEAVTGDIPTPWKTTDNRIDQYLLDKQIFGEFGMLPPPDWPTERRDELHEWDRQLLAAEAAQVGPPYDPRKMFTQPAENWLSRAANRAVRETFALYRHFADTMTLDTTQAELPLAVNSVLYRLGHASRDLDLNGVDSYARLES
jgi:5'-deoxynucleotidase YfbR-like HD superfamily hydrolase